MPRGRGRQPQVKQAWKYVRNLSPPVNKLPDANKEKNSVGVALMVDVGFCSKINLDKDFLILTTKELIVLKETTPSLR